MKEGLHYIDGTYATQEEVSRKVLVDDLGRRDSRLRHLTADGSPRNFAEWTEIMVRRQKEVSELLTIPESVDVVIDSKDPILVWLVADVHAGGDSDYERFAGDLQAVKDVGGYSIPFGDITDSYFWSPAMNAIMRGDEQTMFAQAAFEEMAKGGKMIAAFGGDHDMWGKDRTGSHTLYQDLWKKYGAHYLEGVSYVTVGINDGKTIEKYGLVGSHRHKGFSVYNDAHASLRQWRDEGIGSVVSITAHNHVKAALTQVHKVHGGGEVKFHSLALGTYKKTDRYSRKMGWPRKGEESMGGFGLVLHPGQEKIDILWDVREAAGRMK